MASAYDAYIGGIYYDLFSSGDARTARVTYGSNKYSGVVVIPESVTYGGKTYSVTSIGDDAFEYCYNLTSVTIPNSVTSIGMSAFADCYCQTITLPTSITFIDDFAFEECFVQTVNVSVTDLSSFCNNKVMGVIMRSDLWAPITLIDKNGNEIKEYNIPDGVTSIGYAAFNNCSGLISVTIPNSVTSIGDRAFARCSNLTSITFPQSVTSIGDYAFNYCSSLNSITFPKSVTTIGFSAFSSCSGLTSVNIPNSVTSIGGSAFYGCSSLNSISIPNSVTSIGFNAFSGTPWFKNLPDGIVYAGKVLYCYKGIMPEGTIISIKDGTSSITDYAFYNCSGLASITIPNSVTSIGGSAFDHCTSLTSVTIPNSVTSIGSSAFYQCSSLASITIPNSVTSIGGSAFHGTQWFDDQLEGIVYAGKIIYTYKGNMPEDISLNIEEGTLGIADFAFSGCTGITSITFPNSLVSIGDYAFKDCRRIVDIYCYAEMVPNLAPYAFSYYFESLDEEYWVSLLPSITLYVPENAIDEYKTTSPWSQFKEIVGMEASSVKLNKSKANLEKGKTLTLKATISPSSLSDKSVTWKSSDTKVATVSSSGKVKGIKAGKATITCTSVVTGAKATCKVTVGYVKLDQTEAILEKTKTMTLNPTVYPSSLKDKSVTWKSSNTKVATVSSNGKVKGVKAGTATITCTSVATGLSTTCNVTVGYVKLDQTEAIIEKGKTMTLAASVYPSSLKDKSVTWKSSNTSVATVSSSGKVKGVKSGTATITCTSKATGLKTTCKVIVSYVKLNKSEAIIEKGYTVTLKPTVYPSSSIDQSVTWKSSNTAVATVSTSGKVKGVKAGTATITCTSKVTGMKATCKVTVGYVKLDQAEVSVKKGKTLTLTATVYPSSLEDKSVTWKSSNTAVATVSSSGKVKGIKAGMAIITCTSDETGLSAMCIVTVTATSGSRSLEGDEDDEVTGIKNLDEAIEPFDVYDLSGQKVLNQVTSLDGLPAGVYIVNGRKVLKK